jgi:hypothetical protein
MQVIQENKINYEFFCESWRQWKRLAWIFQQPLLQNSLSQYSLTVQCSVTYPTLSIRVRSSPLSVRASKFRTKMPKALDGSISIFSFSSSPKPTTEASWPLLVTIRIRTLGVGAVFVTMLVPDGRNGTLGILFNMLLYLQPFTDVSIQCKIWGSHSSLPGCDTVLLV